MRLDRSILLAAAVSAALSSGALAAALTPGNIVVTRAVGGTGSYDTATQKMTTPTALTGSGTAATVVLAEYTRTGTLVQEIALPNVAAAQAIYGGASDPAAGANRALTFSGTQNTEGALTLSGDSRYLVLTGYNQTAGVAATNGVASSVNASTVAANVVNRVVGLVDVSTLAINTTTALTDVSSGQAIRSAYSPDGTKIYVSGGSGTAVTDPVAATVTRPTAGIHYTTVGAEPTLGTTQITTVSDSNARVVNGFGGNLFLSSNVSTAATRGPSQIGTGLPTTGPQTPTQLAGFGSTTDTRLTNEKVDDYWFANSTTLYVADSRNGSSATVDNLNGGVQKFVFNANTSQWEFQYNLQLGLSEVTASPTNYVGAHGLSGVVDPLTGAVTLFTTTFDGGGANANRLLGITDTGSALVFSGLNVLAPVNGTFNTAFRGVEVVVPESSSLAALGLAAAGLVRRRRA